MTNIELIQWILLSIAVERLTELFVESEIFAGVRNFISKWALSDLRQDGPLPDTWYQWFKTKIQKLVTCGYCTSVWVGGGFALFHVGNYFDNQLVNWIVKTLVLHGSANAIHVVYELVRRGRVKSIDVALHTIKDLES